MHYLKNFYFKTVKYNLINKFKYRKIKKLPKLKKMILHFSSTIPDIKKLFSGLLALELIGNQKGILIITKNKILSAKNRKSIGCKITLQKYNLFKVFANTILKTIPKLKNVNKFNFNKKVKKNIISYKFYNTFNFSELEKHYYFFNTLPKLVVNLLTTAENKKELEFFCRLFQFP